MEHRTLALGFLLSYALLVVSSFDLVLATKAHLVPAEHGWIAWATFPAHFRGVSDGGWRGASTTAGCTHLLGCFDQRRRGRVEHRVLVCISLICFLEMNWMLVLYGIEIQSVRKMQTQ